MAKQIGGFRSMNPWVLPLQKLVLELKCPLCLNLLKRPSLLPCDHIFCRSCLPEMTHFGTDCPLCKCHYVEIDLRPVSFIENIVTIYRSLDACANLFQYQSSSSGFDKLSEESLKNGVQKTDMEVRCILPNSLSNKDHEMDCNQDEQNVNTISATSSPPSGDIRSSENESYDQGYNSPQNYEAARLAKRTPDDMTKQKRHDSPTSGTYVNLRDSKRHKKLNMPTNSQSKNLATCNLKSDNEALLPDSSTCGFCQSSMISKESGPMLHVVNGKLVDGDEAYLPNAMHVHTICIEWAPQVYFVDEQMVKNLKAEVVRGAKLKCIGCEVEGAALGCYHKSCPRSYHVMCAKKIAGCRWDYENYLMLCPSHSYVKFPNEKKSKSENQVVHTQTPGQRIEVPDKIACSQQSNFWLESRKRAKELVFCGSALCSEDKKLLVEFGMMIGVAVCKYWSADVTHVIAATDEKGAYARTMKVLMAILNGRWVLTIDWVKAGLNSMRPVNEEPYEVSVDNYGCQYGPKIGRLSVLDNAPKLLNGLSFYFLGEFEGNYKEDLQILVRAGGGNIIDKKEEIVKKTSKSLLIYNKVELGEEVTSNSLWEAEEDLAGFQVIAHTWLLESIASYKLQPFIS